MTKAEIEAIRQRCIDARAALLPLFVQGDSRLSDALGSANVKIADVERLCDIRLRDLHE
jgi:threonine aldolase